MAPIGYPSRVAQPDGRPSSSPLTPGYRLDRYELLGPLAEGGMASVWIARQHGKHGFEKLVALKTILPEYAADPRFQQIFLEEARVASRIEHFNVARILDLGEERDVLYLAMEYVDGHSLSTLRRAWTTKGVPVPTGVVLRIVADACSGLHEAHELRDDGGRPLELVHRDVSPHNVLVSVKGVAKLIDFGLAKARDRLADDASAAVVKGKVEYMAPEQALGREVDRRADLWSVGATLYHLLAGKPPYDADDSLATLHLVTSGSPPPPLPSSVHPAIAAVVRKALTVPADRRYATAMEMREAIEAAMADAKVQATPIDVAAFVGSHLSERTAKRRRVIDIALAAAAERERVAELLRRARDRTDSGFHSAPGAALGGSTTSPSMSSMLPPGVRSQRRRLTVAAGAVLGAVATLGVVGFTMLRPAESAPRAAPIVIATSASPPTPPAVATAPTAPDADAIPVIEADSLPKAEPPATTAAVRPMPVAPAWHAPPPPPPKHKKTIDDGF
jgi:serine/threonine-protein kinase